MSHYISLPFNLQALNLETNKKVLEAPNGKRRKLGKVNRDTSEAVKGDGLGEELDSWAPSDFPYGSERFTKSFLKNMRLELGNQRKPHFGTLSRSSEFLDWEKWEKEGQRKWEWGAEERQNRDRRWEAQREKVAPRRNKVWNLSWIGIMKSQVTSLGDGLQEEKAWNFIPSRRWQQILKLYSRRQWGAFKTKPSVLQE